MGRTGNKRHPGSTPAAFFNKSAASLGGSSTASSSSSHVLTACRVSGLKGLCSNIATTPPGTRHPDHIPDKFGPHRNRHMMQDAYGHHDVECPIVKWEVLAVIVRIGAPGNVALRLDEHLLRNVDTVKVSHPWGKVPVGRPRAAADIEEVESLQGPKPGRTMSSRISTLRRAKKAESLPVKDTDWSTEFSYCLANSSNSARDSCSSLTGKADNAAQPPTPALLALLAAARRTRQMPFKSSHAVFTIFTRESSSSTQRTGTSLIRSPLRCPSKELGIEEPLVVLNPVEEIAEHARRRTALNPHCASATSYRRQFRAMELYVREMSCAHAPGNLSPWQEAGSDGNLTTALEDRVDQRPQGIKTGGEIDIHVGDDVRCAGGPRFLRARARPR